MSFDATMEDESPRRTSRSLRVLASENRKPTNSDHALNERVDASSGDDDGYGDDYNDIAIKEEENASTVSEVAGPLKWSRLEDSGDTNARMELQSCISITAPYFEGAMDAFEKAEKELEGTLPDTVQLVSIDQTAVDGDNGRTPEKASIDLLHESFKITHAPRIPSIDATCLGLPVSGTKAPAVDAPGGSALDSNTPVDEDSTPEVGGDDDLCLEPTTIPENTAMLYAALMPPPPRPRPQQSTAVDGMQSSALSRVQSQQANRNSMLSTLTSLRKKIGRPLTYFQASCSF
jgi:hypothetical protein